MSRNDVRRWTRFMTSGTYTPAGGQPKGCKSNQKGLFFKSLSIHFPMKRAKIVTPSNTPQPRPPSGKSRSSGSVDASESFEAGRWRIARPVGNSEVSGDFSWNEGKEYTGED